MLEDNPARTDWRHPCPTGWGRPAARRWPVPHRSRGCRIRHPHDGTPCTCRARRPAARARRSRAHSAAGCRVDDGLAAQFHADPLAEGRRRRVDVHGHVPDRTPDRAHQLALGMPALQMQAAQHAAPGLGVVVLDELHIEPREVGVPGAVVALQEETPGVPVDIGLQNENARQLRLNALHHGSQCGRKRDRNTSLTRLRLRSGPDVHRHRRGPPPRTNPRSRHTSRRSRQCLRQSRSAASRTIPG